MLIQIECFTKQSQICYIIFEQPIELLLVNNELMNEMLLHCITPNNNNTLIRNINVIEISNLLRKFVVW